jgi:hypothetical protein
MSVSADGNLSIYANANVSKLPATIQVLCSLWKEQKSPGQLDQYDNSQRSGDAEYVEHLHLRL